MEPEPWARASPRTSQTPGFPSCCSTSFLREPTPAAPKPERNKIVLAALDGLKKSKPAAFYSPDCARLITIGNFDDDLALIADCDWIIEVVAENLEIKRALLNKVQQHRRADSIITSNTSGLPIDEIVEGMPMELRRHWFGTHFFNPPRYMRLLEIIPTPDTDPADIAAIEHFCDLRLGKTIVHAHDTPNFIANRIGTFSMGNAIRLMQEQGPDHRRGRHPDRYAARLAEDRHLPARRHGRRRCHGARREELLRAGREDRR